MERRASQACCVAMSSTAAGVSMGRREATSSTAVLIFGVLMLEAWELGGMSSIMFLLFSDAWKSRLGSCLADAAGTWGLLMYCSSVESLFDSPEILDARA